MTKEIRHYCAYCTREISKAYDISHDLRYTKDHVYPKRFRTEPEHEILTIVACRKCNSMKNDMHPFDWVEYMHQTRSWWDKPYDHANKWMAIRKKKIGEGTIRKSYKLKLRTRP